MALKLNLDGGSLASASAVSGAYVDAAKGNPAASIRVPGGAYALWDIPALAPGDYLQVDLFMPASSLALVNVNLFVTTGNVGGISLRLEGRSAYASYAATGTGFTSQADEGINFTITPAYLSTEAWHTLRLETAMQDEQAVFRVLLDSAEALGWTPYTPSGTALCLHGTSVSSVTGAWFDNVVIGQVMYLAGNAKLSSGDAALLVVVKDWTTKTTVSTQVPAADGAWSAVVPDALYEVTAYGPAGYQPITHGPVQSVATL